MNMDMELLNARIPMPKVNLSEEENAILENFYSNMMDRAIGYGELRKENKELCKKLEKSCKEAKYWKDKYLELYNYVKKMEDTTTVTIDPMLERIKLGLGVPPIDQSSCNDDSKPRKFGIRYMY